MVIQINRQCLLKSDISHTSLNFSIFAKNKGNFREKNMFK